MDDWNPYLDDKEGKPRLDRITAHGVEIKTGDRVRLHPLGRADVFDIALDGMTATIVAIEQDYENRIQFAVAIDDDPGKDFGVQGKPGHRFFFGVEEVEPLSAVADES
jgi:hypothetical protein